ncbi:ribosomal L7Ae/L30e/S12e/Gadd45 family protein [Tetragenococcus koreensis]|uniref:50S ribosomal protein L7ae n=1 Tax=Tetragenococcus koreensis TaxID=290335 RepID=A0AAN4RJ08_9ENTE|nr:ribosomal L7Ae/L30e/S12e/Gadd45 family protein [Tetragenococcus koreensis]AYW44918.1 50S ribosomal protein L7 [Tetragenococcus koreensis]MCF1586046.1 ribosomal L7Ae/L30e/S12e/Gadd45 family protein [Tetragenococcus koreensis]MCF1615635.1 ribosomal L7Ae/L30e/S12e/Gadd45 family protein [Tetragenococcus koreensis]MCF1617372.1 ribosomal L7Ae/L30e/S12e/Gadd45 family protein [Tetragenococcus koreensis]MCF1620746.1 ribosomal L7Ae/L30e/S12e/Gadd45 family protein [Tetragenococcus koreensis]
MNKQKALSMLGLAMRAGKLVTGEEMTVDKIRTQKVKLALVAEDAGKNTKKKVKDKSAFYQVPFVDCFHSSEMSQAIGRERIVIGVLDNGFANKIEELISS